MKLLHEYIKEIMRCRGVNQSELSRRTYIDKANLSRFLNGKNQINESSLKAICKALQLNFSDTYNKYYKNDAYLCNKKFVLSIENISKKLTNAGEYAIIAGTIINDVRGVIKNNCSKTKVSS